MNIFYDNWQKWQVKRASKGKKKNRSFGQQLFPVFISVSFGTILIHVVSFLAAIIFPAYQINVLTGSPIIGLLLGAIFIFLFIEIPKYVCINTVFENYFDDDQIKSFGLATIAFACISISILSSTYGIELGVKWLAPDVELLSIEQINKKYDSLIDKEKQYWQPKIDKYDMQSQKYFKENAKYYTSEGRTRLSSASSIKEPYNNMLASLTSSENSLSNRIIELEEQRTVEIERANKNNDGKKELHKESKNKASIISFWIMLALELVYIFGIACIAYYRERSEKEMISPSTGEQVQIESQTGKVVEINSQTKPTEQEQQAKKQAVASKQDQPNQIGFKKHGQVFVPEGSTVPKVWYQTAKGGWSAYSQSDLNRMIRKPTGSESWKNELKQLVGNLEDFSTKNK